MTALEKHEASGKNPFSDLNLIALSKYACNKVGKTNEWYLKCIDCPDKTCNVGQRVTDVVEKMTKPEKLGLDERFREAIKHDDPLGWLVEHGYYSSRKVAQNNYSKFREKHPQMPRISEMGSSAKYNHSVELGKSKTEEAKNRIRKIFEGCPKDRMLEHYLENGTDPSRTISTPASKLRAWCNNYPDLEREFGFKSILNKMDWLRNHNPGKTVGEVLEMLKKDQKPEEEELSLEEFLNETATAEEPVKEPEKPATDVPAPAEKFRFKTAGDVVSEKHVQEMIDIAKAAKPEIGLESNKQTEQLMLRTAFGKKRQDLKARIAREEQNLKDLQAEIERLKGQIRTLDDAAALFGMVPTINCGKEVSA